MTHLNSNNHMRSNDYREQKTLTDCNYKQSTVVSVQPAGGGIQQIYVGLR